MLPRLPGFVEHYLAGSFWKAGLLPFTRPRVGFWDYRLLKSRVAVSILCTGSIRRNNLFGARAANHERPNHSFVGTTGLCRGECSRIAPVAGSTAPPSAVVAGHPARTGTSRRHRPHQG